MTVEQWYCIVFFYHKLSSVIVLCIFLSRIVIVLSLDYNKMSSAVTNIFFVYVEVEQCYYVVC